MNINSLVAIAGSPTVSVHEDRQAMGRSAARHVCSILRERIAAQGSVRVIFACAPSQDEFLAELVAQSNGHVDWSLVVGFHMDEYVGLNATHPASFRRYLFEHLLSKINISDFHAIAADATDVTAECDRYATLIAQAPIDLICLGIGENGHLAFNDPPVANFADPVLAKVVELDRVCRQQQVNDGCFALLEDVPRHAITLTLPVFRQAAFLSVVVLGKRKSSAVARSLHDAISTDCPATMLRSHPDAMLFIDRAAAELISTP